VARTSPSTETERRRAALSTWPTPCALVQLLDEEEAFGNDYNFGSPESVASIDLARRVLEQTESYSVTLDPYEQAYEPGYEELGHRVPDTTALSELTGWTQARGLDETIADVVAYERNKERTTERTSAAV
jgi:UDP-glucose 4-epimerase